MRPKSIVLFERLFLAAWLVGLLNTILNWNRVLQTAMQQPGVAEAGPIVETTLYVSAGIGLIIPLLLWFFIARKGSVVAKWILVVLYAIGVLSFLINLVRGTLEINTLAALTVLTVVLQVSAAVMLFKPDTKAWFGEEPPAAEAEDDLL